MVTRIAVENVAAGYGAVRVLHGVSVDVNEGVTVVLLGTNGNGKSTLLKCIMGLVQPEAGAIVLETDGQRLSLVGKAPEEIVFLDEMPLYQTITFSFNQPFPRLSKSNGSWIVVESGCFAFFRECPEFFN